MQHVAASDAAARTLGAPLISIRGLTKSFGLFTAVRDFSLDIGTNEVVSLLGSSGCGKTTTLRCVAGLETPDTGEIVIDGRAVFSGTMQVNLPPERRGLSMVFQQYALWPHMTVFENVAFALRVKRAPKQVIAENTQKALETVRLWTHKDRRISQLSGGQQQRIALARAIAPQPKIILFDEPLSNLDAKLREEVRLELLHLQRTYGFSAIYVTHDQDEAISLSSRIVIMNGGKVEQVASPRQIWREPSTSFVARFIGATNALEARVERAGAADGLVHLVTDAGLTIRLKDDPALKAGAPVEVFIPMSSIDLGDQPTPGQQNEWQGTVSLASFQGNSTLFEVNIGREKLMVRVAGDARLTEGQQVWIKVDPNAIRCYPKSAPAAA